MAMNFSENPNTASNGGDMGFVAESQLHTEPDVFTAIQKLKPSEITDVLPLRARPPSELRRRRHGRD